MKHPSTRELFDYWNVRRGLRPAPERGDIEPSAIRSVLADTFVLAFDERNGHPFRIAGTRVCALFARELKGRSFLDLWSRASLNAMRDLVSIVAHETIGVVASASGETGDGARLDLEILVLPLSNLGRTDSRVLGALAPTETPNWLGACPLHDLTFGTLRYVGPTVSVAPGQLVPAHGRIRHGLVVYDGGLA
jgi:hypothetical protein